MIALLLAAVSQTPTAPTLMAGKGKSVQIRSFDIGVAEDMPRLRESKADLVIVRFRTWNPKANEVAHVLQKGPNGRRIVLVEFPALGVSPKNGLLWRTDWDMNQDGKPDDDAPTWLRARNSDGFYPVDSSSQTLRNKLLGPNGLVGTMAKAGFDGIVVSSVVDPKQKPGFDARLISDMMFEGRKQREGFVVLMRNPGKMMDFPVIRTYLDGFIADGLFFGREESGKPSDKEFVADSVQRLEWASKRGKVVLSIAYTTDADQVSENKRLALERKFIPLSLSKRIEEPLVSAQKGSR